MKNVFKFIFIAVISVNLSVFAAIHSLSLTGLTYDVRANAFAEGLAGADMDNTSFSYHPAAWEKTDKIKYSFTYMNWIAGIQGGSVNAALPLKDRNLGLGISYLDIGQINSYDENNTLIGTSHDFLLGLKGNLSFPYKKMHVGFGASAYMNTIDSAMNVALNLNAGAVYPLSQTWSAGVIIRNIPVFLNADTVIQTGMYYHSKFTSSSFRFSSDYSFSFAGEQNLHLGIEYLYNSGKAIWALRSGYILSFGKFPTPHGLSIGLGVKLHQYSVDFAYTPIVGMDSVFQIGLKKNF